MKKNHFSILLAFLLAFGSLSASAQNNNEKGYYTAPYTRYEADAGTLTNNATIVSSYMQEDIAFEASDRTCVDMKNGGAVAWTINEQFKGIVIRYSVEINTADIEDHFQNESATFDLLVNGTKVNAEPIEVNTYYSWEMLSVNGNSNNGGVSNNNWRMRFDETRYLLSQSYPAGTTLQLVRTGGDLFVDFVEVEDVPDPIPAPADAVIYDGETPLATFINTNGGKTVYFPSGRYEYDGAIAITADNVKIQGAGMWYTTIHFSSKRQLLGGINMVADGISIDGLTLSSQNNGRHAPDSPGKNNGYKGIWGTTTNAIISNVWAEHFECGAWIAKYSGSGPDAATNVTFRHCRFRNNYADGINLCRGSNNCVVEYCSFRNNGDDDMAIWPSGAQCYNNTYRYNTAENCWRASSCALYGGYGNKYENIIIKDNYEVGIRINGVFGGACFGSDTQAPNEFTNIDVIGCGTFRNTNGTPEPAVDVTAAGSCRTIQNINFTCINIVDSKADAMMLRNQRGDGFKNLFFNGITINGTNRHGDNASNGWGAPGGIRFVNSASFDNVNICAYIDNVEGANIISKPNDVDIATDNCADCNGDMVIPVNSVRINPAEKTIGVGETMELEVIVSPSNASNKAVYFVIESGNGLIELNDNVVTGLAIGEAVVKAVTEDGQKEAICNITVLQEIPCDGNVLIKTTVSPVIDGQEDAVWQMANVFNAENKIVTSATNTDGFAAQWEALYDENALYLLVNVVKPESVPGFFSFSTETNNWWQGSDAVEFFIEANGTIKHYAFIVNGDLISLDGAPLVEGIERVVATSDDERTYRLEVAIPWENVGITNAATGSTVKMDLAIGVSRSATATGRIAQFSTFTTHDHPYNDASLYGEMDLKECPSRTNPVDNITASSGKVITAYGNTIEVSGITVGEVISVYNLAGAQIYRNAATNSPEIITGLKEGLYTVVIEGTGVIKKVMLNK